MMVRDTSVKRSPGVMAELLVKWSERLEMDDDLMWLDRFDLDGTRVYADVSDHFRASDIFIPLTWFSCDLSYRQRLRINWN